MTDIQPLMSFGDDGVIVGVGLLLPPKQELVAIEISQGIAHRTKLNFALDDKNRLPYVRLFESMFPAKNIEKVKTNLREISKIRQGLEMDWDDFESTQHFISLYGELDDALEYFHTAILLSVNELREGYFKEKYGTLQSLRFLTPEEEVSLRKWGSPWAEPYLPHLVLAETVENLPIASLKLDWPFSRCFFRGVIFGTKTRSGEFIDYETTLFGE